jgi:hypothetical protein
MRYLVILTAAATAFLKKHSAGRFKIAPFNADEGT